MSRDYQIGDWVIYTNRNHSNFWKKRKGTSLYGKLAKIIEIDKVFSLSYLLEFKDYIGGYDGNLAKVKSKEGHCLWCKKYNFKLAIDHLKFKKWVKG